MASSGNHMMSYHRNILDVIRIWFQFKKFLMKYIFYMYSWFKSSVKNLFQHHIRTVLLTYNQIIKGVGIAGQREQLPHNIFGFSHSFLIPQCRKIEFVPSKFRTFSLRGILSHFYNFKQLLFDPSYYQT